MRRLLRSLRAILLVLWYKTTAPPRILRHGIYTNARILRAFGAKIGQNNVRIHSPVTLHGARRGYGNLTVEDGCIINGNNFLDLAAPITLRKGVSLGPGVIIITHNRFNYNPYLEAKLSHQCGKKAVLIHEGVGVKAGALITMGVTIGENAVIAGGAVVNRDVPARCFAAGVPAKVIRQIE